MQSKAPEDVYLYLALAFTESSLNYYIDHGDNGETVGPCGIKLEYWEDLLVEQNISPYSIRSCEAVFNELLKQYKTPYLALKKYKGIESQKKAWIVKKVFKIQKELIRKYKRLK